MKNFYLTIIITILSSSFATAQFYKDAFDRQYITTDPTGGGASILTGRSPSIANTYYLDIGNGQGTYQTLTGPVLQSLLLMYRATGEIDYLNQFVTNVHNVQKRRDDKMQSNVNGQGDAFNVFLTATTTAGSFTPGISNPRPNAATWSMFYPDDNGNDLRWYASAVYTGEILFPMAQFVRYIQLENPADGNLPCPVAGYATMSQYANWLEVEIWRTIDEHTTSSYNYQDPNGPRDMWKLNGPGNHTGFYHGILSGLVQSNFETSMGRVFAELYNVTPNLSSHQNRLEEYLTQIQHNLIHEAGFTFTAEGFKWRHKQNGETEEEEISHGLYAAHLIYLCEKYGVLNNSNNLLWTSADVDRIVKTFTRQVYHEPLKFYSSVAGNNTLCTGCDGAPFNAGSNIGFVRPFGTWLPMSNTDIVYYSGEDLIDDDIYHMIGDKMMEYVYTHHDGIWGTSSLPLGYANQAYYYSLGELLNPVAVTRSPGSGSAWAGCEGGDIDNDGKDDIVGVRNYTSYNVVAYTVEPNTVDPYILEINGLNTGLTTPPYLYEDVAVGNFSSSHPGDEIIAVTNAVGNIYYFEYNGSSIDELLEYTPQISVPNWRGVCSGDFLYENNVDEIVAVRNADGKFVMMQYDDGQNAMINIMEWDSPIEDPDWAGISCGDLDGDGRKDDVVAVENSQGNIYTYFFDENNNVMVPGPTYTGASVYSEFADVTCGKFCSSQQLYDDIVVQRKLDGDLIYFRVSGNQLVSNGESFFTVKEEMNVLGAGNLTTANRKDELITMRNIDGDVFAFDLRVPCQAHYDPMPKNSNNEGNGHINSNMIYVYPNPTSGELNVRGVLGDFIIEIFTLTGNRVLYSKNTKSVIIDALPKGAYVVRITDAEQSVLERIIKQ